MHIRILGSAAGGGFPQWNCGCRNCASVRQTAHAARVTLKPRTQAQIALSAEGQKWFLAGASPDLRAQIENTPDLHPRGLRNSPIAGVVLASCDLDHVLGLLLLRELQPLRVYAAASILRILREENSMFGMLNRATPQVEWTPVDSYSEEEFSLLTAAGNDSGLKCQLQSLSKRYPKYVKSKNGAGSEASSALFFSAADKRVAYIPAVGELNDALLKKIDGADLLLFDGTFWSGDELIRVQGSGETARQMGHIPVQESLDLLKEIRVGRKMFIHLNNTNPMLDASSAEYQTVRKAGWEVAEDNCQVEL